MKGIILAGGSGTRLYPITKGQSKQQLHLYDKPMIYYPISTLMLAGIRDILIITTPEDQHIFKKMLGDGSNFGVNISYEVQPEPKGLAEAFIIGADFVGNDDVAMILGDNIFYGNGFVMLLRQAVKNAQEGNATIFCYDVEEPQRFGIAELDDNLNIISVEEKPENPKSEHAITGLYFYPNDVLKKALKVTPSKRGELEITTVNEMFLHEKRLKASILGGGYTWFDTGTDDSLLDAANMIRTIQNNKGIVISCLEQIGYQNGWINEECLQKSVDLMAKNKYGQYLKKILSKGKKWNL